MCEIIDKENGNNCMSAVAINTKVNIKNNLQFESIQVVQKFAEKLTHKVKIEIKQVKKKIEKNVLISIWVLSIPKIFMLHQICGYGISRMRFI